MPQYPTDPLQAGRDALLHVYDELRDEYILNLGEIQEHEKAMTAKQERNKEILERAAECLVAAEKIFNFDLHETQRLRDEDRTKPASPVEPQFPGLTPQSTLTQQIMPDVGKPPNIREWVLRQVKNSYPSPQQAQSLRRDYQRAFGVEIHSKTMGMTLYRLSVTKKVRRDGFNWFFVPEPERTLDKENPASGAGSLDDAN
jgi:hypothetical protein